MALPPLSLYVHLPWCERKCPYCDFNSHEAHSIPEDAYVAALLDDLDGELSAVPSPARRSLQTVFIGGGTPSLFSTTAIARLLSGLRDRVDLAGDAEITLEANPGSVERERLAGYVAAGITRFSVGIQSFDDDALKQLGRIHGAADAYSATESALRSGARTFNLDLMHGLPGQSVARGLADLDAAIGAGAPHISWYQLTIEPNTRFHRFPPLLPHEDVLADLEEQGSERLARAGYQRYEVSAWSRPGEECRHNLNYWRFGDYLAIGAGAHGKVTDGDGGILRYRKTRRPDDYLAAGGTTRRDLRWLDAAKRREEFMLGALRLCAGFDSRLFEARTGLASDVIEDTVADLVSEGLLERRGTLLRPSPLGRRFLDDVIGRFFDAGPDQAMRR